jgi:hypothetical protein
MFLARNLFALGFSILLPCTAIADRTVAVDENWKVLIKDDGSWEYITGNRYATGADGKRFKLNADGSWESAGIASTQLQQKLRNNNSDVVLNSVILEISKTSGSSTRKNTRTEMQTIFNITAQLPETDTATSKPVALKAKDISVIDNRGKVYDILTVTPASLELTKGTQQPFSIRVKESLRWGAKAMNVTINKDTFGSESDIVFIATPYDMTEKKVSGFKYK